MYCNIVDISLCVVPQRLAMAVTKVKLTICFYVDLLGRFQITSSFYYNLILGQVRVDEIFGRRETKHDRNIC